MSAFGIIAIAVAECDYNGKSLRIFRELKYRRNISSLDGNESQSMSQIMTALHMTTNWAIKAIKENEEGLLNNMYNVISDYSEMIKRLDKIQEYMPRTLLRIYSKLEELHEITQSLPELYNISVQLHEIKLCFISFWDKTPEILIRLPRNVLNLIYPEMFLREDYLPYTLGIKQLPDWVDPQIIMTINEARKIKQTNEQTIVQQNIFKEYLYHMTLNKSRFSSELIDAIISFIPIDIVFDLMNIKSPIDFLHSFECEKYEKYTYSSSISIYTP